MKIENIEKQVKEKIRNVKGAHDYTHLERVLKLARFIAEEEKGDVELVSAMALLHDIVRPEDDTGVYHALDSSRIAKEILENAGYSTEDIDKILSGIKAHSIHSGKEEPSTLEERILFDADKIDALGYIGVARWFMAMSNKKMAIDDAAKLYIKTLEKFKKTKGGLYTKTGNKIAQKRYNISKKFMEDMLREMHTRMTNEDLIGL